MVVPMGTAHLVGIARSTGSTGFKGNIAPVPQVVDAGVSATRIDRQDDWRATALGKRAGTYLQVSFEAIELPAAMPNDQLLALNDALEGLVQVDAAAATLVKQRFFVGLSQGQAAELLGLSRRTADRLWAFARAWLFREIRSGEDRNRPG